jgi:hypothetical protein
MAPVFSMPLGDIISATTMATPTHKKSDHPIPGTISMEVVQRYNQLSDSILNILTAIISKFPVYSVKIGEMTVYPLGHPSDATHSVVLLFLALKTFSDFLQMH